MSWPYSDLVSWLTRVPIVITQMYTVCCMIQTRMQVLVPDPRANYRNVPDAMFRICRYEGAKRTFRGISAVISGAGPAHAMYFASYEWVKKSLSSSNSSNHLVHGEF